MLCNREWISSVCVCVLCTCQMHDLFLARAVLRFEVDIEDFLKQSQEQQLVFDPNLTPYQVRCA